ncbi:MAG: DUF4974 domain-containing protein, partial [Planctomycetes bacterium]|nr:DUF4974 domain-containing protein [Planctomycetota bacterium]
DDVGGPGSIEYMPFGALVVRQTQAVHRQIEDRFRGVLRVVGVGSTRIMDIEGAKTPKKALVSATRIQFIETPLQDIVDYLKDLHNVEIVIEKRALAAEGVSPDVPITVSLQDMSLASVLSLVLEPHDLTWIAKDNKIVVTSANSAAAQIFPATHPAADFTFKGRIEGLLELVMTTVRPSSWIEVGGPASVRDNARGSLVVRQTFWGQQEVGRLLDDLRLAKKSMN